jgi:hypothetical protein
VNVDDAIALLRNVSEGLRDAQNAERTSARKEGMEKARSHYIIALDIANRYGTPEMIDKL